MNDIWVFTLKQRGERDRESGDRDQDSPLYLLRLASVTQGKKKQYLRFKSQGITQKGVLMLEQEITVWRDSVRNYWAHESGDKDLQIKSSAKGAS